MTSTPPYRFGVSEFTTMPWSFEEDIERYTRLGVDAIEVCEIKLGTGSIEGQLDLLDRSGLQVCGVQPSVRTLFPSDSQPSPREVPARMERFRRTIERFGDRARGVPFVTNSGIPPDGNIQLVFDTAAREYQALADYAAERGALIAFEPLNASIMNIESAVWTLKQGMEMVRAVDRPNFGICLDFWNIWQNAGIEEAIRAAGDRIFTVEVSDWRTPRSTQDRLIVGQGEIPLAPLLHAAHDSGYRGPYAVEIFSDGVPDALWRGNLAAVITESRAGLDRAWNEAFR